MTPAPRPRVLLADDYEGILTALRRILEPSCEVVGCVTDGAALLEAAARLEPDVIVLDIAMPEISGLEACRQIKQIAPQTTVVILTAADDAVVRREAFKAGASAFVLKCAVADELSGAIQKVFVAEQRAAAANQDGPTEP